MYLTDDERIRGLLLGAAAGDAIGSSFEGSLPAERRGLAMAGGGPFSLPKGSVTDDTLMTMALLATFFDTGCFSRDDFLLRMVRTVLAEPATFGNTTKTLAALLTEGCFPVCAVQAVDRIFGSRTNGSVMRTFPVGILYPSADEARRVSGFTHADPLAGEACAAVSLFASELLSGIPREAAYRKVRSEIAVPGLFEGPLIPSVDAAESVRCAMHCFMHAGSFRDAVESAVSLGGDTDTIGSVAGGLAGAFFGVRGIPADWIAELSVRDKVESLAGKCVRYRMICSGETAGSVRKVL